MQQEYLQKLVPVFMLILLVGISFVMLRPYLVALLSAFILAYLVYPIHRRLARRMSEGVAAGITVFGMVVVILVPLIFLVKEVVGQILNAMQSGIVTGLVERLQSITLFAQLDLIQVAKGSLSFGVGLLSELTLALAGSLVTLLIVLFSMYYLLLNWSSLTKTLKSYLPFERKEKMIRDMGESTKAIVHGTLLLAIIEFIVAAIGFYIAGIDYFLILAALIAIFAFLPGGPAIVWAPTLLVQVLRGFYGSAAIVLVSGFIISIGLDVVLRTKIVGNNSSIHPVIMLLGIMGGTPLMGLAGIVAGPLLLSYTLEILGETLRQHNR